MIDSTSNSAEAGEPVHSASGSSAVAVSQDSSAAVLRATAIEKSFGVTRAVSGCSLELRAGEVHVLMGENGSGKSTMVKILSGVHRPDSGTITIAGQESISLASPRDAMRAGIATVFQEILVTPQQSVLENAWLGADGLWRQHLSDGERREQAAAVIGRLIRLPDLDLAAEHLGLNDRQAICIARAVLRNPRVLILDEATSALDITTRDNLFTLLAELCERGTAVLFISHRMDEVERIADKITVMRSGSNVGGSTRAQFDPQQLVQLMVGSEHPGTIEREANAEGVAPDAAIALRVRGVRLHPGAADIDCDFRAGEIVGVAGLEGQGQHEFLEVLSGSRPQAGTVETLFGADLHTVRSRADALHEGIAYVPRDRRDEALFPTLSVLENFGVASMADDRRRGLISRESTQSRFTGFLEQLRINVPRSRDRVTTLSGGNQQKVIIARWLALKPRVLVLNDPTRGVDLGAKNDIYRVLGEAAAAGTTVIMLSTELIELIELMDRVLVFREGAVFCELERQQLTRARLVAGYFGRKEE